MIKGMLALLCAAVMLAACGCSGDGGATSGELEYDTFENVMAETDDLSKIVLENITLTQGITVNKPQRLVSMTIANKLPDKAAAKRLADAYFPDNSFTVKEPAALSDFLLREDTADGGMISLEGYGFFGFAYSDRDWQPQYDHEGKIFLNARRDSMSLKLCDGELDLDKALILARETADKYSDALGMERLVPTIAKYNSSGYMIRFAHSLGGWLLPDQPLASYDSENSEMIKSALQHEVRCCGRRLHLLSERDRARQNGDFGLSPALSGRKPEHLCGVHRAADKPCTADHRPRRRGAECFIHPRCGAAGSAGGQLRGLSRMAVQHHRQHRGVHRLHRLSYGRVRLREADDGGMKRLCVMLLFRYRKAAL